MLHLLYLFLTYQTPLTFQDPISGSEAAVSMRLPQAWLPILREKSVPWADYFSVQFGENYDPQRPSMLGAYRLESDRLRFFPRFEFLQGRVHWARFELGQLRRDYQLSEMGGEWGDPPAVLSLKFLPQVRMRAPQPEVVRMEPNGPSLPANCLRIYLWFSQPMRTGLAPQAIRLYREAADGTVAAELTDVFVGTSEELWNPEQTRLTLFFDPGRLKRGVGPHELAGNPLQVGQRYLLITDTSMKSIHGEALKQRFQTHFEVEAEDRKSPDPESWRLELPKPGTNGPLELHFDEPLDMGMLRHVFRLEQLQGAGGHLCEGVWSPEAGGKKLLFLPVNPWVAGRYQLKFLSNLEDRAGNQLNRLFDMEKNAEKHQELLQMNFEIHEFK